MNHSTFRIAALAGILFAASGSLVAQTGAPANAFGTPCGTTLKSERDSADPTRGSITIDGPDGATFNLISLATGQGYFMMSFGCPCLVTPIFASLVLPVDAFGDSTIAFDLPQPGIFTMQALTTDAAGRFHLSNGLQF